MLGGVGGHQEEVTEQNTDSQAPIPQMLINSVFLPDEWDMVWTYKDIKTDAHQLRGSQEDVPMRAGDGFLKLLTPHLPVSGAEKARKSKMSQPASREHPSTTVHPTALHLSFLQVDFMKPVPPNECQPSILPTDAYMFSALFLLLSIIFDVLVVVRFEPTASCMLGQETTPEHPQPSCHFLRQ